LLALLVPALAAAQSVTVAIPAMDGKGGGTRAIGHFQTALKKLKGVKIQSTRGFLKEARAQGVLDFIADDARAVSNVSEALGVDVIVFGKIVRPDRDAWPDARKRDRVVRLTVIAATDGRIVGEHEVLAPRGRLSRAFWREAARAVERDLFRAGEPPPPPPPPPPPRRPEPEETLDDLLDSGGDLGGARTGRSLGTVYAGVKLMSRSFSYAAAPESAQFAEGGIEYESSFVPGFVLDATLYPLSSVTDGAAAGLGVELHYEKVFLVTRQEVASTDEMGQATKAETELDTTHDHVVGRLLYQHRFGDDELAASVRGFVGFGVLAITIDDNEEYNGTTYSYLDVGVGGSVPLSAPYVVLDAELHSAPVVSLGDSAEELGGDVTASGLGVYAGISSFFGDGLVARAGIEYLALDSEVDGEGRGGRVGVSAEDAYLGMRLQAGYRF